MSYKNLPIDRVMLVECLDNQDKMNVKKNEEKGETHHIYTYLEKTSPRRTFLINVHYNPDATTSFNVQGKNSDFGISLLEQILPKCIKGDGKNINLSFKNVGNEAVDLIKEFLIDECGASLTEEAIPHGTKLTFNGQFGDAVTLISYKTGTLTVQGKRKFLYTELIDILARVIGLDEVISQQLKTISINITVEETLKEFKEVFPESYKYLGDGLAAIISPALTVSKLDINLTDYSCLAFPALRGLEGYIRKIFLGYGIIVGQNFGDVFDGSNSVIVIKANYSTAINDPIVEITLCNLYKYYKDNRHGLFHTDNVAEASRMLESKTEADVLLFEVIRKIEDSYLEIGHKLN